MAVSLVVPLGEQGFQAALEKEKELFNRLGIELSYQCTAVFSVSQKDCILDTRDVLLKTTYSNHRKEAAIMENMQD